MAKINDIHSLIVPVANANLTAHTYTEVFGGSAGCTISINSSPPISIGASSNIGIWVRNFSGGTGCFFLGEFKDVVLGSQVLGGLG